MSDDPLEWKEGQRRAKALHQEGRAIPCPGCGDPLGIGWRRGQPVLLELAGAPPPEHTEERCAAVRASWQKDPK